MIKAVKIRPDETRINSQKTGFFRYRKIKKNRNLLTNDLGEYIVLPDKKFKSFLKKGVSEKESLYPLLREQGLIRDHMNFPDLAAKYQKRNLFLWQGPSLHIIVVSLRCDHRCVYCQASSRKVEEKGFDLNVGLAKKIVDVIFKSPSKAIAIEFQGGEPLLNWPVVKFIVEYAKEKNKIEKKNLELRLVSNLSRMDDEKLEFLVKNEITLCTSLDGPESIHNKNRIFTENNSYQNTVKWLKKAQKIYKNKLENKFRPGAIVTISRHSLKYPKEIVNEYLRQGIEAIFVRPLTPLGVGKSLWKEIGYSSAEYLEFYKKALNHIINYALKKPKSRFHENFAKIMLAKILNDYDPNYLELRSPCGGGIGQILYNYDGKVYTCDEGRMLGEDLFCIGDVGKNGYNDIISHPAVKSLCLASCLDGLSCDLCVYKPYCGVCPIYNYATSGNIFSQMPANERCKINKGIFDFLFEKMKNKKTEKLFAKWAKFVLPVNFKEN